MKHITKIAKSYIYITLLGISVIITAYPPEALNGIINYLNNDDQNDNTKKAKEKIKEAFQHIIRTHGTAHEQEVLKDLRKVTVHKQRALDEFLNEQDTENLIQALYRYKSSIVDEPARMDRFKKLINNYQHPPFNKDYQTALQTAFSEAHVHDDKTSTFPILWELWKTESPQHKIEIGRVGMRKQHAITYSKEQYDNLDPATKQNLFKKIYLSDRLLALNVEPDEIRQLIELTMQDDKLSYEDASRKVLEMIPEYNRHLVLKL